MKEPAIQEIDLTPYARAVWARKWLILLAALIPAGLVGGTLFLMPAEQIVSYSYTFPWTVTDFRLCQSHLHSTGSLKQLAGVLEEAQHQELASKLDRVQSSNQVDRIVTLDAFPPPTAAANPDNARVNLVTLSVTVTTRADPVDIADTVRSYFETMFPLWRVRYLYKEQHRQLLDQAIEAQTRRVQTERRIESAKTHLQALKQIAAESPTTRPTGDDLLAAVVIAGRKDYLPIEYQIEANQTEVASLHRELAQTDLEIGYARKTIKLLEQVDQYIQRQILQNQTIQNLHTYLVELTQNHQNDPELAGMLSRMQSHVELNMPSRWRSQTEPSVDRLPKGTASAAAATFAVVLAAAVVLVLVRESTSPHRRGLAAEPVRWHSEANDGHSRDPQQQEDQQHAEAETAQRMKDVPDQ